MIDLPGNKIGLMGEMLDLSRIQAPLFPKITWPAESMYKHIVTSIAEFEKKLDESQEVGLRLVSFASTEVFHIEDVGYRGSDLIKFYGKNADGHPVELMQHISQVSVLLVATRKQSEKANRIGFILMEKVTPKD